MPELALSRTQSIKLAKAWLRFAELWIPDFETLGFDPKWVALGMLIWAIYSIGRDEMKQVKIIRERRKAKSQPVGPVVDSTAEEVREPVFNVNGMGDIFAPFDQSAD